MKVLFRCYQCRQVLETDSVASFFSFRCPKCDVWLRVPKESVIIPPNIIRIEPQDIICPNPPEEKKIESPGCSIYVDANRQKHRIGGYCENPLESAYKYDMVYSGVP